MLLSLLALSASIQVSCKHPQPVFVPIDTNVQRIIETRDFDSLLILYFKSLGQARLLEVKLRECEKGEK
jgi:hypothetical protein